MSDILTSYHKKSSTPTTEESNTDPSPAVQEFETEYRELANEYKAIMGEMYELFAAKHMD